MNQDIPFASSPARHVLPGPDRNVWHLVFTVVRRWWAVAGLLGLLLGSAAATAAYLLVEPQYEARAVIRVSETIPYIAFPETGGRDEMSRFVRTQIELIRSPLVLGPVVSKEEIARLPEIAKLDDPINELAPRIAMTSLGGSELVNISYRGPNRENAAKLVNAVTDAYFALRDQHEAERSARVIELLEKESAARSVEVARIRENVRELAKQTTGEDPFGPAATTDRSAPHPLAELQSRLNSTSVEAALLRAQVTAFEEWAETQTADVPPANVERAVEQNSEVQRLRARIAAGQVRLRQIETAAVQGREDPAYVRAQEEVRFAEEALNALREDLQPKITAELEAQMRLKRESDLLEMQARLEGLTLTERELSKRYDEQLRSLQRDSGNSLELEFKRDELNRAADVYDRIVTRTVALRTERGAPARVELLIPASAPVMPISRRYKEWQLAFLIGFSAPLALLLLWEWRARRISDTQQLQEVTSLTVIGEIASLPSRVRVSGSATGRSCRRTRLFQESIDSLRTSLLLTEGHEAIHVLAVTSATSREGKTSVAAELAVSLAQDGGVRTLLIDADMRAPDLHDIFEIELTPGLTQVLEGQVALSEAIVPTLRDRLDLLPAGRLRHSPHHLLGTGALQTLLDEVRTQYRYVIIDTPPVLPAAESLVVARAADATVFCVMRDVSRVLQVRTAFARLRAAGAKPLGAVFNNVPVHRYAYTYGDYSYHQEE